MTQATEDTRTSTVVAIHSMILVLFSILAFTGNSLVCLVSYQNRRLRTITNIYVLSLAVIDIMASIFVFPFLAVASGLRRWPFSFNICQFSGFITYFWGTMSVNIMALTALNRYICIVKPHLYPTLFTRKKTLSSILLVFPVTLTPCLTATLVTPISFQWDFSYLVCEVTGMEIRAGVSKGSVGFVLCLMSSIIFCYGNVYHSIRRHNHAVNPSLQETTSQGTVSAHEIQASRVLLVAVIGFGVCWIPVTVTRTLNRYMHSPLPSVWLSLSSLSAFLSSWINPIIYGFMNRTMRKDFLKLLLCGRKN